MKRISIPKPRSVWEWLAFFSPAITMIICGTLIPKWINTTHHETGSRAIALAMGTGITWGIYGIVIAGMISVVLGFQLVRKEEVSFYKRCAYTCAYAFVIAFINLFVAFPGCIAVNITGNALSR